MWRLRTGAPGRGPPDRYGVWRTVHDRFDAMRKGGRLDRMLGRLRARLDADGPIDPELWCLDGTVVRASRAAAGAVAVPKQK